MSILYKNWNVEPCPEHGGKHPLHDSRLITAPVKHRGAYPDPLNRCIVARMTDLAGQREAAHLIAAAPDLLSALKNLCSTVQTCRELDWKMSAFELVQVLTELERYAARAIEKTTGATAPQNGDTK